MNIDEMEAGRQLDAMIAEKVMGYAHPPWQAGAKTANPNGCHWSCSVCNPAPFSSSIAAAWQVVEKRSHSGVDFYLERHPNGETHWARFNDTTQGTFNADGCQDKRLGDADAQTAPLAICRAALKAVQ